MAIRPLCRIPHEGLRRPADPVTRFAKELRTLVQDLLETMHAHEAVGLAAPQIGQGVRVFVANPSGLVGRAMAVVNPILEAESGEAGIVEGCLSVPDAWERVPRRARVRLRGQDPFGRPLRLRAEGLLAIVIQHELDHLEGRLIIDARGVVRD